MPRHPEQPWQVCDRFLELHSRWMTLIGEHLQDDQGQILDYWRIEKADSVIVLPIQGDRILLPSSSYRPGIGQVTQDFPGGRVPAGQTPEQAAIATLQRELGINAESITQLILLNPGGWPINSSFSNQKLFGFVAHLENIENQPSQNSRETYSNTPAGIQALLNRLVCIQCRAVLMEWILSRRIIDKNSPNIAL